MREAWLRLLTSILAAQTLGVWSACVVYITFGLTLVRGVEFQKAVIYIRVVSECILSRFNFMYIYYGYESDFLEIYCCMRLVFRYSWYGVTRKNFWKLHKLALSS